MPVSAAAMLKIPGSCLTKSRRSTWYPVMPLSPESSQASVTLLCVKDETVRPVGASGADGAVDVSTLT